MQKTDKDWALYRCKMSCSFGKRACEGIDIPDSVTKEDWIFFQLFSAIEDLAMAMGGKFMKGEK